MQKQIAEIRQSLFDEGHLGNQYLLLEELEAQGKPNFVQDVLTLYFRDSTMIIASLEQAIIGAIKVYGEASKARELFLEGNLEGTKAALQEVKREHSAFKAKIQNYFQMKRIVGPADPAMPSK